MAAPTNDTNQEWNDFYYGNACPKNDTGVDGAPVALGSHDSAWARGSVNRSVRNTWLINGNDFSIDDMDEAEAGKLSLANVGAYVFRDMAYGFKGDAINQQPGDMMWYRAYPVHLADVVFEYDGIHNDSYRPNRDGTPSEEYGDWLVVKFTVVMKRRVVYDVVYSILYDGYSYEVMVRATDKYASLYRPAGHLNWLPLPQDYIYGSVVVPTVETLYEVESFLLFPGVPYFDTDTLQLTVTDAMIQASCVQPEWTFKRPVKVGGVDIEEMYENPTTAQRTVSNLRIGATVGRLGQKTINLDANGDFQIGYAMATGNTVQVGDCMSDVFAGDNITHQYLWTGSIIPTYRSDGDYSGDGETWLVDTIYKLGDDNILEGIAYPVGFPVVDTTPETPATS